MADQKSDEVFEDDEVYGDDDAMDGGYGESLEPGSQARPARGATWILFLASFGLVAGGAALALAPRFSWELTTRIGSALAELGVLPGVLIASGVTMFGVAFVARAIGRIRISVAPTSGGEPQSDSALVIEQLAGDLAQTQGSLAQVLGAIHGLQQGQSSLLELQSQQGQMRKNGMPGEGDASPIFRLAASVDKLNARLDEGLLKLDKHVSALLGSLAGSVEDSLERLSARLGQFEAAQAAHIQASVRAAGAHPAAAAGDSGMAQGPHAQDAPEHAVEQVSEFEDARHPMDLEFGTAPAAHSTDTALDAPSPPLPTAPEDDLGLLDEMERSSKEKGVTSGVEESAPASSLPAEQLDALLPDDSIRKALGE